MSRARRIVRLASDLIEDREAKEWLVRDERGTWEGLALSALDSSADRAAELGLSTGEVDAQCATYLAHCALTTRLREGRGVSAR